MVIQWVPSHVGVDGNKRAVQQAAKRAKASHEQVLKHKAITDIWAELGLQEMPETTFDSDSNESGGSQLSDGEGDEAPWSPDKRTRF